MRSPIPRKLALGTLLAATVAVTPLLVGSARPTDMGLLVAMSTITDVRDSLEEKLTALETACREGAVMTGDSRAFSDLERSAEVHFRTARDINELALNFLGASSSRYPEYTRYWNNYRQRLSDIWRLLDEAHGHLEKGPAALAARLAPRPAAEPPAVAPETAESQESPVVAKAPPAPEAMAVTPAPALADSSPEAGKTAAAPGPKVSAEAPRITAKATPAVQPGSRSGRVLSLSKGRDPGAGSVAPPSPLARASGEAGEPKKDARPRRQETKDSDQAELIAAYRGAYRLYSEGTPGALAKARSEFESLLAREPAFHLCRYWLGRILLKQGDLEEARRQARTLLRDQPGLKIAETLLSEVDAAVGERRRSGPSNAVIHRRPRIMPFLGTPLAQTSMRP